MPLLMSTSLLSLYLYFPNSLITGERRGKRVEDWLPTYKHQTVADIFRGGG